MPRACNVPNNTSAWAGEVTATTASILSGTRDGRRKVARTVAVHISGTGRESSQNEWKPRSLHGIGGWASSGPKSESIGIGCPVEYATAERYGRVANMGNVTYM